MRQEAGVIYEQSLRLIFIWTAFRVKMASTRSGIENVNALSLESGPGHPFHAEVRRSGRRLCVPPPPRFCPTHGELCTSFS